MYAKGRLSFLFLLLFVPLLYFVGSRYIATSSSIDTIAVASDSYIVRSVPRNRRTNGCIVNYMNPSKDSKLAKKKTIFYMGDLYEGMAEFLEFKGCEYSNCVMQTCGDPSYLSEADVVLFAQNSPHITKTVPPHIRQRQLWFVYGVESPATSGYGWNKAINSFNGTMTYLHTGTPFSIPYGLTYNVGNSYSDYYDKIDFSKGKTKGAFAYVSNCHSKQYDRLKFMKELSKYVEVDIFGGCTNRKPCPTRFDAACMSNLHSQYRFYLAFENSLCTEYITEKFWRTFQSDKYFIPVALGGLSLDEYNRFAPPNSFIHAYNFTSIAELGKYLKLLMSDDAAFNRYHQWRQNYTVIQMAAKPMVCDFCKMINQPEMLAYTRDKPFADEWNNPKNCKALSMS